MRCKCFLFVLTAFMLMLPLRGQYNGNLGLPSTDGGLWCCFFSDFSLEVAALYWKTCRNDILYAITQVSTAGVDIEFENTVDPEYEWGVRAKLLYADPCDCFFASLEYTWFKEKDRDSVVPQLTTYFARPLSILEAEVETKYQRVRGNLGYYFWNGCKGNLYAFGGVSWIYIKEEDNENGITADTPIQPVFLDQDMRFNGAGFEVGFGGRYLICDWLGVAGEFNGVGGVGRRKYDFETFVTNAAGQRIVIERPTITRCIPGIDLKLEAFVRWDCFCPVALSVGYEHHEFFDALWGNRLYFGANNSLEATHFQENRSIGFGGLFVAAKLNY